MLGVTVNAEPLFPVIYIFLRVQLFISPVFSLTFKNSLSSKLGVSRNNRCLAHARKRVQQNQQHNGISLQSKLSFTRWEIGKFQYLPFAAFYQSCKAIFDNFATVFGLEVYIWLVNNLLVLISRGWLWFFSRPSFLVFAYVLETFLALQLSFCLLVRLQPLWLVRVFCLWSFPAFSRNPLCEILRGALNN